MLKVLAKNDGASAQVKESLWTNYGTLDMPDLATAFLVVGGACFDPRPDGRKRRLEAGSARETISGSLDAQWVVLLAFAEV